MSDFFHSIENVPYTDLHNLNLDWIVNTVKQAVADWLAYKTEMDNSYSEFTENILDWKDEINQNFVELQEYVRDYFANLDVTEEVRTVINSMIDNGSFITVLLPSIKTSVEDWLEDNITPTTPVVDATLTISGAAADSKTVGDRALLFNQVTSATAASDYSSLVSNLPFNTFSFISASWFNDMADITGSGTIYHTSQSANVGHLQVFFGNNGNVYSRNRTTQGVWSTWKNVDENIKNQLQSELVELRDSAIVFNQVTEETATDDYSNLASNLPYNTFSFISASWFNDMTDITGNGTIYHTSQSDTVGHSQVFIGNDGKIYSRYRPTDGVWSVWKNPEDSAYNRIANKALFFNQVTSATAASDYSSLASNLPYNTFSFISSSWFNDMSGISGNGTIFHTSQSANTGHSQIFVGNDGNIYSRWRTTSGVWSTWRCAQALDISTHYYAYGDSTTKGQVGTWSGEQAGTSAYNYPAVTGKRLKMTVHNMAVGGQSIDSDYADIYNDINNTIFESNTKLITIGWAYNNTYSNITLGTYTDTTDNTFIGKYYNIMKLLQQKNKNALVCLVTGYGHPGGSLADHIYANLQSQFTHVNAFIDGNYTTKEVYDELEKMCNLHGWPCINQAKGSAFNEFNASDVFGDNIHPTNNGYKIYSNFLAGKIMALFANNKY